VVRELRTNDAVATCAQRAGDILGQIRQPACIVGGPEPALTGFLEILEQENRFGGAVARFGGGKRLVRRRRPALLLSRLLKETEFDHYVFFRRFP
jgi:hypothetical protein